MHILEIKGESQGLAYTLRHVNRINELFNIGRMMFSAGEESISEICEELFTNERIFFVVFDLQDLQDASVLGMVDELARIACSRDIRMCTFVGVPPYATVDEAKKLITACGENIFALGNAVFPIPVGKDASTRASVYEAAELCLQSVWESIEESCMINLCIVDLFDCTLFDAGLSFFAVGEDNREDATLTSALRAAMTASPLRTMLPKADRMVIHFRSSEQKFRQIADSVSSHPPFGWFTAWGKAVLGAERRNIPSRAAVLTSCFADDALGDTCQAMVMVGGVGAMKPEIRTIGTKYFSMSSVCDSS